MLIITVPGEQVFNEATMEFGTKGDVILELEHSLASLSKWESKFEKPFLESVNKTPEELVAYIEMMIISPSFPDDVVSRLSEDNVTAINNYINAKMTATWFSDDARTRSNGEIVTAELIYYWMIGFKINWEAQHWHLNRLFTLIRVCGAKQEKPKKMSKSDIAARNRKLNEERRARLGTSG
jgi:hypothetical protein